MHYILEKLGRQQCYIMGDFNLDLLKHEKHPPTKQFLDMMNANAFIPLINRPTLITKKTSTLIDNIFMNNYDIKDSLYSGILQTDVRITIRLKSSVGFWPNKFPLKHS